MSATDVHLAFELNQVQHECSAPSNTLLIDLLRERYGLTGAKLGCSRGVCGSCTVLLDGRPAASCQTFAFEADGARITTIEGLSHDAKLDALQQAFIDRAAFQCGYCTSGMILLARALLQAHPHPDRDTIIEWMSSNACRCTGYELIIEAVEAAARGSTDSGPP